MDQERKFLLLKKRLDALHYCQPLGIDSVQLVEKLLNDLVKTTEGFQQLKKQLEEAKINAAKFEQLLLPLKKENQRIVNENNQLHMTMIQIKEECESKDNKWRTQVRMLESERNDWKFILGQKNVAEKKLQEELLRKGNNENTLSQSNQPDKTLRLVDQIQDLEKKLLQVQQEARENDNAKVLLDEKCKHFEFQIENREKEILRLKSKLDLSGTNIDKLAQDYQLSETQQRAQRLQTQLDLLTEENTKLNEELSNLRKELSRQRKKPSQSQVQSPNKSDKKNELAAIRQKLSAIEEEKSKLQDQFRNTLNQLESDNNALKNKIQNLQALNEQLQAKAQNADQVISAYQTDKMVFSKAVNNLKNDKDSTISNLKSLEDENQKLKYQLNDLDDQLQIQKSELMQIQREKELHERNFKKLNDEYEREKEFIQQLRQDKRDLERELDQEKQTIRELKIEFERMDVSKQNLDSLLQKFKQDQRNIQQQPPIQSQGQQILIEQLRKENDLLTKEVQTTENLLKQIKKELGEKDRDNYELKQQKRMLSDQISEITQKNANLEAQIQIKNQEVNDLELENDSLKREQSKLRLNQQSILEQKQRVENDTFGELKTLQQNNNSLKLQVSDLNVFNGQLEEKIKVQQDLLNEQRLENDRLNAQLRTQSDEFFRQQQTLLRNKDKDSDYYNLSNEVERLREQERKHLVDKERNQNEIQRLESVVNQHVKQIEFINKLKDEAMKEARELRQMINGLKSTDHESKNTSIKLSEKVNNFEITIADLKEQLQRDQIRSNKLYNELTESQQIISQLRLNKNELESQIKQLKTLSEGLEKSREELLQRLQQKNSTKIEDERQVIQLKDLTQNQEEKIRQLQEQLTLTKRALEQLDRERDEVQNQLDEVREANIGLEQQIRNMNNEIQKQNSKLNEVSTKGERGYEAAQQLEEKLRDAAFKNQKLLNENDNLKYTIQVKEKELNESKADLSILSKENQQLNNQVVKLSQERELTLQQIAFLQQQEIRLKEQIKMYDMETHDLQLNYSEVCAENQRLTVSIQQISMQHEEVLARGVELEKQEDFFKVQMQNASKREDQYQNQLQQYEREIERLNRKSEEYERQIRELLKERDQIGKEYHTQRKISTGFQAAQEDFNRQMSQLEREKAYLENAHRDIQKQLDLKEAQLSWEQKRVSEMEQVIIQERQHQMHAMQEMQQLKDQNEQLLSELEKAYQPHKQSQSKLVINLDYREQSSYISQQSQQSGNKDNSQLDQSSGWERLKQESENFKKTLSQAAVSSQNLKQKMKSLQKEYEVILPSGPKYL